MSLRLAPILILFASQVPAAVAFCAAAVDAVDVFVGTSGNGHCHPAASRPFGLVQAGPDTGRGTWDYCSGYQHADRFVYGFSQTHLSGTGVPELGDVQVLPFSGPVRALPMRCAMDKTRERAAPGSYATYLPDEGVSVEIAAARRAAIYRLAYEKGNAGLLLNLPFALDIRNRAKTASCSVTAQGDRLLVGSYRRSAWLPDRTVHFVLAFDRPWQALAERTAVTAGEPAYRVLAFDVPPGGVLTMKVALSLTSVEAAKRNLDAEIPGWDVEVVRRTARTEWAALLARSQVEGDDRQRSLWNTALYHLYLQPNDVSDVGEPPRYTTLSLWDTYRAAQPWYGLVVPELIAPEINSMLELFRRNGRLPVMSFFDQAVDCMVGNHAVSVIADACSDGVRGVDWNLAYEAVRNTLRERHPDAADESWAALDRYGYVPYDLFDHQTVSMTLECAYDDACAARFAKRLGKDEDAAFFRRRSESWKRLWDPTVRFFRGRHTDGSWREPFAPFRLRKDDDDLWDYTEANAWQYRWHVQQAPGELIGLFGGPGLFVAELERFFQISAPVDGLDQHDVSGLIGQYAQGNEPSHHAAYLFTLAGRPDLTANYVRKIVETQYAVRPDGLCGNDDCGQMSAWYVFSALGFYPVDPCGGEFVVGAPQVPKAEVEIRSVNGERRKLVVIAKGLSDENKYVRSVTFDGRPLPSGVLLKTDVRKGGRLVFEMCADAGGR